LNEVLIDRGLRGAFGRPLRFFDEIGSTNTEATAWAMAGAPEGALVVTDHQTAGRGRWGRDWVSEPGTALQMSLVIRPRAPLDVMGLLTTAVGVACSEAVEIAAGVSPRLKWPNDLTVRGRKLAGILVESHVTGPTLDFAVIGIGLNVRPMREEGRGLLGPHATNVYDEIDTARTGKEPTRVDLLGWILDAFERVYRHLGTGAGAAEIVERATKRSEVLGAAITIALADGSSIVGVARRLLPSGALEVEVDGEFVAVRAGEITRLRRK
jgi:BirA family transcriptional regulator, biotin operon repressor / biotin---[acetyl-CoA-carboxylase] ligase